MTVIMKEQKEKKNTAPVVVSIAFQDVELFLGVQNTASIIHVHLCHDVMICIV